MASSDYVTVTTQFDALGRKTFASNPNAVLGTSYQFDELDRTTRIENSDGSFITQEYGTFLIEDLPGGGTTYHADTKVTDEEGHVSYTYTRLYGTHSDDGQVINVINDVNASQFKRNLLGNITEVIQGTYNFSTHRVENSLIRTYNYDSHQFLESVVYPETGATTYGRDAVGNLTSKQVSTSPITYYQYDGRDRLTDIDYPVGTPDILMEYDGNDNLTYTENSNGSWSYVYDDNDNLSQESLQLLDGSNLTLSFVYTYDGLDNRSTITL
ncbi:MAG: hypothetical protein ABW090_03200 [Sedimenticola sp.]